jgi:hypothetical protein
MDATQPKGYPRHESDTLAPEAELDVEPAAPSPQPPPAVDDCPV